MCCLCPAATFPKTPALQSGLTEVIHQDLGSSGMLRQAVNTATDKSLFQTLSFTCEAIGLFQRM